MMPVSGLRLDHLVPVSDHAVAEHDDEPVHGTFAKLRLWKDSCLRRPKNVFCVFSQVGVS